MKKWMGLAALVCIIGIGCAKKEEQDRNAAPPVDNYCYQYGQQDPARCPGFSYQNYGNYNYYGYNYGSGAGTNPVYNQWTGYTAQGCPAGYTPVGSPTGYACYLQQQNFNYYSWQGSMMACGYTGAACPTGYYCSNNYGAGVCVR